MSSAGRIGRVILATLALFGFASAAVLLVRHRDAVAAKDKVPPAQEVTVTTVRARTGRIGVYLDAIGTVTPVYTASIMSEVTGIVVAVHYVEGQNVNRGDPLIDIDSRPYRATLLQAEGALERDTNLLAQAEMDLVRYREAWARRAIARQMLDDQEKIVLQDEGTVKNDEGAVRYDQVQVDFCHITAPIAGRVGLRLVDPGNVVYSTAAVTLAVITQIDPITVIFTIPEDSVAQVSRQLRADATLEVLVYDRTGQKQRATGTLLTIDNQIDTTTGTVKGRALFSNALNELFPNQFVNTRLLLETQDGVTLLDSSAVQHDGASAFVYTVGGGVAHRRTVQVGVSEGAITKVDGLAAGDLVANSSFDKLHDGAHVTSADKPALGAPADAHAP